MTTELLIFEVAGEKFSVPLDRVEEVVPIGAVTEIPNSPPFLLGLTAVRGKVMSVIDAAKRYGIGPALKTHLLVCQVRGSLTAIAIDRPLVAGALKVRELNSGLSTKVPEKFLRGAFELLESDEAGVEKPGARFFAIDPDLFVSTEMASKVGEV